MTTLLSQKEIGLLMLVAVLALVFVMPPMSLDWINDHANYPTNDCGHNWFYQISRHVMDNEGQICGTVSREELGKRTEQKMRDRGFNNTQTEDFAKQEYGPDNPLTRAINDVLDEMAVLFRAGGK